MPAERTRGSRRTAADGDNLVWTQPSTGPGTGIAFATNLTPSTFTTADSPATQTFFMLDPSTPSSSPSPRRSHKRRDTASNQPHIPRPPNAFILFRSSFVRGRAVPATAEPSHAALSAIAGMTWSQLPAAQKAVWYAVAKEKREEHAIKFPGYTFRPARNRRDPNPSPRDDGDSGDDDDGGFVPKPARDLPPADHDRAAHIADLLVQGFHGESLERGIELYDAVRGKRGPDIRFSVVETPEGRRKGSEQPKRRKTAQAVKRSKAKSSPPAAFDFTLDFSSPPSPSSTCSSPIDSPSSPSTPHSSSFEWPSAFDFSTFDLDSLSTAPASPALSFASTSSGSLSASSSYEDLAFAFADPLVDLDLDLGFGMGGMDMGLGLGLEQGQGCGHGLQLDNNHFDLHTHIGMDFGQAQW